MSKLWNYIKEHFLTKAFIIFCVIGVINTAINFVVMKLSLFAFDSFSSVDISTKEAGLMYFVSMGVSTMLAFVVASIFSYYANAIFTYKQKKRDSKTFIEAFIAFVLRFALTYLFTLLIWWLMMLIFKVENDPNGWLRTTANLIASIIMIPPFYLILGVVFKRANKRLENNNETNENNA